MRKLASTILLCILGFSSAHSATVNKSVSIKRILVYGSGNFIVDTHETLGGNCYGGDRTAKVYYHSTNMTQDGLDRTLSLLLTAKTTNKKVILYFDDSNRNCLVSAVALSD